ncbi:MAG: DUF411 domain-containing protein [Acidobacteriota bacterium]|nr:DUF411 domain-containing protein [Acidobacteriota bacterium]
MKAAALIALFLTVSVTAAGQAGRQGPAGPSITVYKTPTCGCCSKWVDHMRQNGFVVTVTDLNDVTPIKTKHGVPRQLHSCHTGIVNGYVIEGHIPASDVKRLLREKPKVAGLAVPGMPSGSPGMEVGGNIKLPPYSVLVFEKSGASRVFSTQQPGVTR